MEITIDNLVSAREEALKREELTHAYITYSKDLALLENKISEINLKLEITERELMRCTAYSDQVSSDKMKTYKTLLEENKSLKRMYLESSELKLQTQMSQELKDLFKRKYEEVIVSCVSTELQIDNINDQNIALKIESLQQKLIETETQASEIIKEKDYIKKKVIPVLESTMKLYEKNKSESEDKIEELRGELRNRCKRSETHSASPVSSKSSSAKILSSIKTEITKLSTKTPRTKTYMPSYLSHSKPNIKRSDKDKNIYAELFITFKAEY
ncbi:hypothetical protein SteCoe_15233 [Stentor coeruleus]|uniref:Uncharacterized protein n=1 Tax=Stentor coeruleus TaxID=5963 RepID=A0A1R2C423_9CILI|nr:hypothetical protein SteCoe_15233 [Stentor coeruleus]